mmetsp:Transcript_15264/g.47436  ORF Transcript_15264/g.47436 Transcript_15264/m.47436 type:complete len:204 (-) Transcript_15264:197-808(-)
MSIWTCSWSATTSTRTSPRTSPSPRAAYAAKRSPRKTCCTTWAPSQSWRPTARRWVAWARSSAEHGRRRTRTRCSAASCPRTPAPARTTSARGATWPSTPSTRASRTAWRTRLAASRWERLRTCACGSRPSSAPSPRWCSRAATLCGRRWATPTPPSPPRSPCSCARSTARAPRPSAQTRWRSCRRRASSATSSPLTASPSAW